MSETSPLPDFSHIQAAAQRLQGKAVVTPLLENAWFNEMTGGRLFIKAEPLQLTGSFKFRGAYNKISQLDADALKAGVVAFSSGNHAQGVAMAAKLAGSSAVIVMPEDAPRVKIENTKRLGARVVPYDRRDHDAREGIASKIAAEEGRLTVKPFDDPDIICGQGTTGLELVRQAEERGVKLDGVISPAGGAGLLSGVSIAVRELLPDAEVYSAEPEDFDDTARTIAMQERQFIREGGSSICDALLAPAPGILNTEIICKNVTRGYGVSDEEVGRAMALAFLHLKLVVEPGGAVALAAVLSGKLDIKGRNVCVICSGGNVDPQQYADILRQYG